MDKMNQPIVLENSNMLPKWAQMTTDKTAKLPPAMTFSGKRA